MGHGALDEDRAHDSEQGQPYAEEEGDASRPRTKQKVAI